MSNIIFLFQKLLIKQNHKTDSFFLCTVPLSWWYFNLSISYWKYKIYILIWLWSKDTSIISWFKNIEKHVLTPQLSLLPIISQSLGKNLHKYMQNLKLIIKVKAKTPDMNIDKITKHKMDAKWQNFNHSYTKYNKKLQPLWSSEVFTLALLDFLSEKLSNTKNPQ